MRRFGGGAPRICPQELKNVPKPQNNENQNPIPRATPPLLRNTPPIVRHAQPGGGGVLSRDLRLNCFFSSNLFCFSGIFHDCVCGLYRASGLQSQCCEQRGRTLDLPNSAQELSKKTQELQNCENRSPYISRELCIAQYREGGS